eukprot:425068_1
MTSLLLLQLVEFFIIQLLPSTNGQTALIEPLLDTSFNASSFWDTTYLPHLSRFSSTTAWGPSADNPPNEWLQIDLGLDYVITSISTKGSGADNEFVKTFQLNYATDTNPLSSIIYPQTFQANTNRNGVVENILTPPFIARYLRFYPLTSNAWPSMRVEAFGYIGTLPPTKDPTQSPTPAPTNNPTPAPTTFPTPAPTDQPTQNTIQPTKFPTKSPTPAPTKNPTPAPTQNPTNPPTTPTSIPTKFPTYIPTETPTKYPSSDPTTTPTNNPTIVPTKSPTENPTTISPTSQPTNAPSKHPTTDNPTITPTIYPSNVPTVIPTMIPTSGMPSIMPSISPSGMPSEMTEYPSESPTNEPTMIPIGEPTMEPVISVSDSGSAEQSKDGQDFQNGDGGGDVDMVVIIVISVVAVVFCLLFVIGGLFWYNRKKKEIISALGSTSKIIPASSPSGGTTPHMTHMDGNATEDLELETMQQMTELMDGGHFGDKNDDNVNDGNNNNMGYMVEINGNNNMMETDMDMGRDRGDTLIYDDNDDEKAEELDDSDDDVLFGVVTPQ